MSETVGRPTKGAFLPTAALLVGAIYCLIPVFWLISASTKTAGELASTFTLWPSFNGGFQENLVNLFQFNDGEFFRWTANSIIYSVGGAVLCTIVSAAAGYGLAKYSFRGKNIVFNLLLIGVLIPGVILAIPQYLLLSRDRHRRHLLVGAPARASSARSPSISPASTRRRSFPSR